jgi:hypothetical protein
MWAVSGGGVYASRDGKMFHGVGMADEYKNLSLLQVFSENRAKDDLKKVLGDFGKSLVEGYLESEKSKGSDAPSDIYIIERDLLTVRSVVFDKAEFSEHWLHPKGGKGYSLVTIKFKDFIDVVKKSRFTNKKFKDFAYKHAEDVFDDLIKERGR